MLEKSRFLNPFHSTDFFPIISKNTVSKFELRAKGYVGEAFRMASLGKLTRERSAIDLKIFVVTDFIEFYENFTILYHVP